MKPTHVESRDRLIVALDLSSIEAAEALIARLGGLPEGDAFHSLAAIVADQAAIADGGTLPDPAGFLRRLNEWLLR